MTPHELWLRVEESIDSGDLSLALRTLRQLEVVLSHADAPSLDRAEVARRIGNLLDDMGLPEESLAAYDQARRLADGDEELLTLLDFNVAQVLPALNRTEESIALLRHLVTSGRAEADLVGAICMSVGNALLEVGDPLGAAEAQNAAIEAASARDDVQGLAHAMYNLGNIQTAADNLDAATEAYRTAMSLYSALPDRSKDADCLDAFGTVFAFRGRFTEALAMHDAARAIYRRMQLPAQEAIANANRAWAMLQYGAPDVALGISDELIAWHEAMGATSRAWSARVARTAILCELGRLEQAASLLDSLLAGRPDGARSCEGLELWMRAWVLAAHGDHAACALVRDQAADAYRARAQLALARETSIYPPLVPGTQP